MRCNNKTRFILAVVAEKLKISNRKRADIEEQLVSDGYDKMPNRAAMVGNKFLPHRDRKYSHICIAAFLWSVASWRVAHPDPMPNFHSCSVQACCGQAAAYWLAAQIKCNMCAVACVS